MHNAVIHTIVCDPWRAVDNHAGGENGNIMSDCQGARGGAEVGGPGNWYRFMGARGDALPLTSPREINVCGTRVGGWLTGWDPIGLDPVPSFNGAGRYPSAIEGVVEMTVCFDGGNDGHRCSPGHTVKLVGVLNCHDFLLWRLPSVHSCNSGYCTTQSELFEG